MMATDTPRLLARPPLPLCATPPGSTPPGAGFYVPRIRLGGHGFATAADALSNAEDTCTDAVAILEHNGDYAWVFPAEYGQELADATGFITVVNQ